MHPFWSFVVPQLVLFSSTSNDQKDVKHEMKEQDGCSDPGEQLDASKEASNVAQEQSATANTDNFGSRKLESTKVSQPVSPSPGQLEGGTPGHGAGVAEEIKSQTQMALALLTFSAGAILSAKGTSFQRQQAGHNPAGDNLPGFWFWWSIGLWFISLLSGTFTALAMTFGQQSPGLLLCAKRINAFSLCVSVAGVAFWIIS